MNRQEMFLRALAESNASLNKKNEGQQVIFDVLQDLMKALNEFFGDTWPCGSYIMGGTANEWNIRLGNGINVFTVRNHSPYRYEITCCDGTVDHSDEPNASAEKITNAIVNMLGSMSLMSVFHSFRRL